MRKQGFWDIETTGAGPGLLTGLLAGSAMVLLAMLVSASTGDGFWFPAQLIGATFYGVNAILGGTAPAITGLLFHLAWAAILGGLFAPLVGPATPAGKAVVAGLLFGISVWAVMTFAVLPWADPVLRDRMSLAPGWWFACHLLFGGGLGLAPALMRAQARAEGGADRTIAPERAESERRAS